MSGINYVRTHVRNVLAYEYATFAHSTGSQASVRVRIQNISSQKISITEISHFQ